MAEELNVKINADGSKLTSELGKVSKSIDSLNNKSNTIEIKTNYSNVLKNIEKIKTALKSIAGKSSISIGLSTGQTLNRLKAIDDRLSSIKKNSNIKINVTENIKTTGKLTTSNKKGSTVVTPVSEKNAITTTYPKEQYKTLQQQAKNAALLAEKNYNTPQFEGYKEDFTSKMQQLVNYKKALGDLSTGQEKGIYSNMARSLEQTNPVYDTLINKVKSLNKEQSAFNELVKAPTVNNSLKSFGGSSNNSKNNVNDTISKLKLQAIEAGKLYNSATGTDKILEARNNFGSLLDKIVQVKRETGDLSYRKEGSLFSDLAPTLGKNTRAFKALSDRIKEAGANYKMVQAGAVNNSTSGILGEYFTSPNLLRMVGSFERGTGSGIHEVGRQFASLEDRAEGVNTSLFSMGKLFSRIAAGVAVVSFGISAWKEAFTGVLNIVQSIASAIVDNILKPAFEAANAMQMMRNGIAGAMTSIGLLDDKPIGFATSLEMANNIIKQISVNAIKTGTSLDAISNTFRAILEPGLQSGMNITQIENMASLFTTIGQELQLNSLTIARDTRDIFNGMANRTVMAKQLGITDDEVKGVKARGEDLYAWLSERLKGFIASNRENIDTLGGAFNSLKSTWELSLASVFDSEGVKEPIVGFIKWVRDQIATVYDMKINPGSQLFEDEKKAISAQKGIPVEEVDVKDDATKFQEATGASDEETQALEDSGSTVILLGDNFKSLINVVSDVITIFADAVDELASFVKSVTDSDDATEGFEKILEVAVEFLVYTIETIINTCIALYKFAEATSFVWELLGGFIGFTVNVVISTLVVMSNVIMRVAAAFGYLAYMAKAAWQAASGDISGTAASIDAANGAIDNARKKSHEDGDYLKNLWFGDDKEQDNSHTYGDKARELQKGLKEITSKGYLELSHKDDKEDSIKGRPGAEDDKANKKAQQAAIKESQKMLKEKQAELKEILSDTLDKLKEELEQNEVAFKEGFKSMQDYYNQKAELEQEEAEARLQEAKEERAAIEVSQFSSEYDKLKAIHDVDRNIAKYSKAVDKASKTVDGVSRTMQNYTEIMNNVGYMISSQTGKPNGSSNANLTDAEKNAKGVESDVQTALENWGNANGAPVDYIDAAINAGLKYSVDPKLIISLMKNESGFNQDVESSAGAVGLMQLMPDTASSLGVDPNDAIDNIYGGAKYIGQLLDDFGGNVTKAVAAYNAGPQAVMDNNGVPPYAETQAYVDNVLDTYQNSLSGIQDLTTVMDDLRTAVQKNTVSQSSGGGVGYLPDEENSYHGFDTRYIDFSHYLHGDEGFDVQDYVKKDLNLIANEYWVQSGGNKLGINALAGGEHPSNDTDYGHAEGYKADLWWETDDGILGKILDKMGVAAGREFAGTDNDHIDVSFWSGVVGGTPITSRTTGDDAHNSYIVGENTQSETKEVSEAKSKANEHIQNLLKLNSDTYSDVLGVALNAQLTQISAEYDKKISDARNDKPTHDLLVTQKTGKIIEATSNYLSKALDFNLERMEETLSDRAYEITTGQADSASIVKKYYGYFTNSVADTSDMVWQTAANQLDLLEKEFVKAQNGGYVKQAETIRKKIRATIDKMYSMFDTIISAIDKKFDTIGSVFGNISMTNLQRERGEIEIKAYKNQEELKVRQAKENVSLEDYWKSTKEVDNMNKSLSKLTVGTKEYNDLKGLIIIKNDELIAQKKDLESNRAAMVINEQLARIPTLLDDIKSTSKQALEDGLVTFLTDGVNEAKNLSEALMNMAVTFLKTMQQMFAKKLVLNLMEKWYRVENPQGGKADTEKLASHMDFTEPYRARYTTPALQNSMFGANSLAQANFNAMKPATPKYGFDYNSLGLKTYNITDTAVKDTSKIAEQTAEQQLSASLSQLSAQVTQSTTELSTNLSTLSTSAQSASTALSSINSVSMGEHSTGGFISGDGTETSDSIPSRLSNGEFVVRASSVRRYGLNFLNAVNGGYFSGIHVRKFATGGYVADTGTENTARGMSSFGKNIGNNASFTGHYNLILATNQQEAMDAYMKSPAGQRVMLEFNKNNASVINRLGR